MDQRLELLWKWALRTAGLIAFFYLLFARHLEAPAGAYMLIAGLVGLPNIIGLQRTVNQGRRRKSGDDG